MLKAVCKLRTGVHLGKFPMVRRTLSCRRCNFKRCLWSIFRITFSNSFPVVVKRPIGRKLWENLGSLLGFGNCRRRWLNNCVRCTSCLLGRSLRHSFGIPSSPWAFLNFNEFTNLCTSQGLTFPKRVSKSMLCYDRRTVGQSVLMSSRIWGTKTRFLLLSGSCEFVHVGRPLWRKKTVPLPINYWCLF
jgi:hypothetical protein